MQSPSHPALLSLSWTLTSESRSLGREAEGLFLGETHQEAHRGRSEECTEERGVWPVPKTQREMQREQR